jgi:hypothetical protein
MRLPALLRHPSLPALLLALAFTLPPTHGQTAPAPPAPAAGTSETKAAEAKKLAEDLVRLTTVRSQIRVRQQLRRPQFQLDHAV